MVRSRAGLFLFSVLFAAHLLPGQQAKREKLTLDEFFDAVGFESVQLSPDGHAVVMGTNRAEWEHSIFRRQLWLFRDNPQGGTLIALTQGARDTSPRWSPDGNWIGFLAERKPVSAKCEGSECQEQGETAQLYVISPGGGESIPLTQGEEEVHAFAWSSDARTLYFATRTPWTKQQKDDYRKQWQDAIRYREAERGDTIFALDLAQAIRQQRSPQPTPSNSDSDVTRGAQALATLPWRVQEMTTSPDGQKLAFLTSSVSERQERVEQFEIFVLDLHPPKPGRVPRQLTKNQAVERQLKWSADSRHIFFTVEVGDVEGAYRDLQPHLYWLDLETGRVEQWNRDFIGSVEHYAVGGQGVIVAGREGTEVPLYAADQPGARLSKLSSWPGTYEMVSMSPHSSRLAFVYSALDHPSEVYLADTAERLESARPITSWNKRFTERELPQGKPYRWVADDGTTVEGMLLYPPEKFEQKKLPLFTLIHGGPAGADGNHFEADWYQWDRLAATQGWLVFEPNYRGSTGYGDRFLLGIVPQIVSRPGKDILEGIDALVKDGTADPDHLAVGGYSYGGYMTNWLITQTTRFKAAVSGAGAVEHVANWGNDDTTFDDAYFLGGRPWEADPRYHDEAAIFQIHKVITPTHVVAGSDDIRVSVLEDYLLERALNQLGIPSTLLIFPHEGHDLSKNPWHGKIKVREELKWLQKYGGMETAK